MKEKKSINNKSLNRIYIYFCLLLTICFAIVFFVKFLQNISIGADNQNISIDSKLEKYINYEISDQDKGTLVQYNVKIGIEEEDNKDYIPLKESELYIGLNQIDNKYPYNVKVIAKSTELTNGKIDNVEANYEYDQNSGNITIKASNQNENGEFINSEKISDEARDEYIIIGYYDTYVEQLEERELDIKVHSRVILSRDDTVIEQEKEFKGIVKDNIGELTSVEIQADEVYNGYIKSNIINGTNYDTEYKETAKIMVSKKEAQQKIEFTQSNSFEKVYQNSDGEEMTQEFASNSELVYKSSKIKQQDIKKILGENGIIEILNSNGNLIATIDGNTQFAEDGSIVINYESELESIVIKTSNIENEGILTIENTKKIKDTMKNIDYNKIKSNNQVLGINEELVKKDEEAEEANKKENIVYTNNFESTVDIKDATNNINMDISNVEWTNKYQNEITFNVYISSNTTKDNMLKDPTIKIELPSEVEKVILGENSIIYANGIELQNPYVETSENGNLVIVANLVGTQTSYNENTLGLITDVKISATIILKKDIKNTEENINLTYTNQYNTSGKTDVENRSSEIKIISYNEKQVTSDDSSIVEYSLGNTLATTNENVEGLEVEVTPVKGDTVLKDGDTVYEGEFIKYNIKVTNTSDKTIDSIKVVGSVPEGTVYGELEADYNHYMGEYKYIYNDELKSKNIEIGTLKPREIYNGFYEINVCDLQNGETEKNILTNIKTYIGETEVSNYEIINKIEVAKVKVFLGAFIDNGVDCWNYSLKVESQNTEEVTVKLVFPESYKLEYRNEAGGLSDNNNNEISYSEDVGNTLVETIETNKEYWYWGKINSDIVKNSNEQGPVTLIATATIETDGKTYKSNENRIEYEFKSVSVTMTSENEGEEVQYEDEINYDIVVKNTGKTNLEEEEGIDVIALDIKDYLPDNVDPISMEYEYWKEIDGVWEKQIGTKNIGTSYTDKEGNKLPNIDLTVNIPYGESIKITVKTKAGYVFEKTKIENSATVSGDEITIKTSNIVTHTILPYELESGETGDSGDSGNSGDSGDNSNDPDNPQEPVNPTESNEKYFIQGVVWLDENKDGKRQTSEKKLDNIEVILINTGNSNIIKSQVKTDSKGEYKFSDLDSGKYIVLFKYDTDTYRLTDYKKAGVANEYNSDASKKEVRLQEEIITVGATDVISLDASTKDIDIGLIENEVCDLKLDKYISKVSVTTTTGTKEYNYDNEKLAKIEIKSKEIEGATVVITYKIVVTNEGEIPVSVSKIIDYLPEGLTFSSELNKDWGKQTNGQLVNNALTNKTINVGESVEVNLILTKKMNANATGQITNVAEIGEIRNSLNIADTDSAPANKVEGEDDYSKADLIISISTGGFIVIGSIIIAFIILISSFIILSKKGILDVNKISKISKITIFILIFSTFIFYGKNIVVSSSNTKTLAPNPLYFWWDSNSSHRNDYGSICFWSNSPQWEAHCIQAGRPAVSGNYTFTGATSLVNVGAETSKDPEVTLDKSNYNDGVNIKPDSKNEYWIYGPLKVNCQIKNSTGNLSYKVEGKGPNGEKKELKICDKDGKELTLSGTGEKEFYVKVNKNDVDSEKGHNGLFTIKLTTTLDGERVKIKKTKGYLEYTPNEYGQIIKTVERHEAYEYTDETECNATDYVEWKDLNIWIEITKVDEDNENLKLKNVSFYIKQDSGYLRLNDKDEITGTAISAGYGSIKEVESIKEATNFRTGEDGKVCIQNIKGWHSYSVVEESNKEYGYTSNIHVIEKVNGGTKGSGQIYYVTMKNAKLTGNLQIVKEDGDVTGKKLSGIEFRIKQVNAEINKTPRADINQDGKVNYKDLVCLQNFIASIESYEGVGPHLLGDINDDGVVNVDDATDLQLIVESKKNTAYYVVATDSKGTYQGENSKVRGTISLTNIDFSSNSDDATIFVTDEEGKISILNMLTGDYIIEEVSVGNNFGYDVDPTYISYKNSDGKVIYGNDIPVEVTKQSSTETGVDQNAETIKYSNTKNIYNSKKYIKLSGYAWKDEYKGKQQKNDGLYTTDSQTDETGKTIKDERLNNVEVTLYKADGSIIDTRKTAYNESVKENGYYIFGDYMNDDGTIKADVKPIEIDDLEGAYIQFRYNGLDYQTVDINCIDEKGNKVPNGNTAGEFTLTKNGKEDEREKYNKNFLYVENNRTNVYGLSYNEEPYDPENGRISKLNYGDNQMLGYDGAKKPIFTPDNQQYYITARTETNTNKNDYRLLGQNKTIEDLLKEDINEINNINLGLYEREQPDIAIVNDIQNVSVSINGFTHIYQYAQRFNNTSEYVSEYLEKYKKNGGKFYSEDENGNYVETANGNYVIDENGQYVKIENLIFNVGVKFGEKYGNMSYSRPVYKSDYTYEGENDDNDLKVSITYRIGIMNESSSLISRVNSIVDYYDKKYTIEKIGRTINEETGDITDNIIDPKDINKYVDDKYNNDKYNKIVIPNNTTVEAKKQSNIYIQFVLDKDTVGQIAKANGTDENNAKVLLDNVVEINSYSIFDKNENIYAGIDKDSNPGNAEPRDKKTYEDDTDSAPALKLVLADARKITGTVFLDEEEKETSGGIGNERKGNGKYDQTEKGIEEVKITLEGKAKGVTEYLLNGETKKPEQENTVKYTANTNKDGNFTISDFIPGDYTLTYTWGGKTYKIGEEEKKITVEDYKGTIYQENRKENYTDNTRHLSWYRGDNIQDNNEKIRYSDAVDNYETRKTIDSEAATPEIQMDSTTPTMKFGVEFEDDINNATITDGINKVEFIVPNIDFGIVERPRQELAIEKRIKSFKITLANGQVIADAEIVLEDGKYKIKGESPKGVIYTGPSATAMPANGQIKAEIDNELIQGSTLQVTYEIEVKNNSEVDYDYEDYYKYGIKPDDSKLITLKPSGVYDYLDDAMSLDKKAEAEKEKEESNDSWKVFSTNEYNNAHTITESLPAPTILEEYIHSNKNIEVSDGYIIEESKYEDVKEILEGYTVDEWNSGNYVESRKTRLADKTILHNEHLEEELKPGCSNIVTLNTSKVLANKDEIELNNDTEITKIERTSQTGRKVTPITSIVYDRGETVTITTPTGENKEYGMIIGLTISTLVILGTGIVFIKKKILG